MTLLSRIFTALLIFAFVGGSQACVAMCSVAETRGSAQASRAPEKACHHCAAPAKEAEDSKPMPTAPCKHCEKASADRMTAERSISAEAPAITLAVLSMVLTPMGELGLGCALQHESPPAGPPNQRLHVVCVLLI